MSGTSRAAAATSRTLLRAFGGLNETYSCTEAEVGQQLKNFSSRDFPALSTRIPPPQAAERRADERHLPPERPAGGGGEEPHLQLG